MARKCGGKCTAYPTERRMLMAVGRAVPWSSQIKNREKSCERSYFPVCSHLTREGTGSKGLMVTRIEKPGNAGLLFFYVSINIPIGIFFLNNSSIMRIIPKRQEMASQLKGKIMKYFIAIFTAVLLSLGFIACGDEESDTAVEDTAADAADAGSDAGDAGSEDAGEGEGEGSEDAGAEE